MTPVQIKSHALTFAALDEEDRQQIRDTRTTCGGCPQFKGEASSLAVICRASTSRCGCVNLLTGHCPWAEW